MRCKRRRFIFSQSFSSGEDWHAKITWGKGQSCFSPNPFPRYHPGDCWTRRIKCIQGIQKAERDISFTQSFSPLMQYLSDGTHYGISRRFTLFRRQILLINALDFIVPYCTVRLV